MAGHKALSFAPRLLFALAVPLSGCGGWPKFAHPYDALPTFDRYPTILRVQEDPQADFAPGLPAPGLDKAVFVPPTNEVVELNQLFGAAQILGTISSTQGLLPKNDEPFSDAFCPEAQGTFGLLGNYKGDVDFIKVNVGTGGLCMVLSDPPPGGPPPDGQSARGPASTGDTGGNQAPTDTGQAPAPPGPEIWDVLALPWNEEESCISGSFFPVAQGEYLGNKATIQEKYSTTEAARLYMPGTNFATLATGQALGSMVVMIALGTASAGPRPYSLHLLPTRDDPRSCTTTDENGKVNELTADNFEPPPDSP